jgi:hypothetical protein
VLLYSADIRNSQWSLTGIPLAAPRSDRSVAAPLFGAALYYDVMTALLLVGSPLGIDSGGNLDPTDSYVHVYRWTLDGWLLLVRPRLS